MASFEDQLAELESVVSRLEAGGLGLEESVTLFESGMRLSNDCKKRLADADSRIQVLLEPSERGAVKVADLDVDVDADEVEDEDEE